MLEIERYDCIGNYCITVTSKLLLRMKESDLQNYAIDQCTCYLVIFQTFPMNWIHRIISG
jgi:hypothetical protein